MNETFGCQLCRRNQATTTVNIVTQGIHNLALCPVCVTLTSEEIFQEYYDRNFIKENKVALKTLYQTMVREQNITALHYNRAKVVLEVLSTMVQFHTVESLALAIKGAMMSYVLEGGVFTEEYYKNPVDEMKQWKMKYYQNILSIIEREYFALLSPNYISANMQKKDTLAEI